MRTKLNYAALAIATALTMSGTTATVRGETLQGEATAKRGKIQGTWNMLVTFVDCTTADPLGGTGVSLVSFAQGGVITELARGSAPSSRHPGLGVWRHVQGREYAGAFKFFRYNPDGTFAGRVVVNQNITYEPDDTLSIAALADFYDAAGTLLMTRCVSTIGTRFTGQE
jgi:hypothetical protein